MEETITSKMVSFAKEMRDLFEEIQRLSQRLSLGEKYWSLKHYRSELAEKIIQEAHGYFYPDDFKYKFIVESFDAIIENEGKDFHEVASSLEPDVYTHDLLRWLSSHIFRVEYCDEAVEIGFALSDSSMIERMMAGQILEKREVFFSVVQSIYDICESEDTES